LKRLFLLAVFRKNPGPAEHNYTPEMRRKRPLDHIVRLDDTKRHLVIALNSIDLVARHRKMEEQPPLLIGETQGHRIRLAVVPSNRQDTRRTGKGAARRSAPAVCA
jgi:hypothetical protein